METKGYTLSRNHFQVVSSKPNFISKRFNLPVEHIACKFAHLVLYYILTSFVSMCNHIYCLNMNDLEETVDKWREQNWIDMNILPDVKDGLSNSIHRRSRKRRVKRKGVRDEETKSEEIPPITEEEACDKQFEFLQSML